MRIERTSESQGSCQAAHTYVGERGTTPAPFLPRMMDGLDPDASAVIDELVALGPLPLETLEPRVARELPSPTDAVMAILAKKGTSGMVPRPARVEHKLVPGRGGDILVRIYSPAGAGPHPVLVYFHGGGWVIANLNTYDGSARELCVGANCIVVSVAYRQAPEAKFPAATEDAYAATQWVFQNAASFGGDPTRIAIGGESAGGNLATVTCLIAKEKGGAMPIHHLLVYPVISPKMDTPSYKENKDAKPLNAVMMAWFWKHYLASPAQGTDPRVSPALARDFAGLPPATVITAAFDPLRDEGEAYAKQLQAAGIPVTMKRYEGVPHEFFGWSAVVAKSKTAMQEAVTALKAAYAKPPTQPARVRT